MWMLLAAAIGCAPIGIEEGVQLVMLAPEVVYLVRNWTAPGWPVETSPTIEAAQRRLTATHCRR